VTTLSKEEMARAFLTPNNRTGAFENNPMSRMQKG
jgi:hypothetical protein